MTVSEDDDLLAGEYVLGTLDPATHGEASARRVADADFAAAVAAWEERLLPIEEHFAGIEPPSGLWPAVLTRVREAGHPASVTYHAAVIGLERRLRGWRRTAQAAMAIAALLALWVGVLSLVRTPGDPQGSLVAVLQPANQSPAFLLQADLRTRELSVSSVAPSLAPNRSFELWLIDPAIGQPKSLGLLGAFNGSRPALPDLPADLLARATYAVTVEPSGGSPTGQPTSAPIYLGHLTRIGS